MKNINKFTKDKNNITPLENAFFSGRYDCFNKIINNDFNNNIFSNLNKNLNDFLKNITRKKNKNIEIKNLAKERIIPEIKYLLKNGDTKDIMQLIEYNKKLFPFNDYKSCKKIVNCIFKIGNIKNIEIMLKLIDYKKYPIAPFIGKYGLIKWLNELLKYGIDLFQSDKNVLNGKTIFDFCIESNNSNLYKLIFNNIESPNKIFLDIISKNFVDALLTNKNLIVGEIIKQLRKPKFKNMKLSIEKLSYTHKTTSKMINMCLNLNFIDPKTLDIYSAVKFCRPSVVRIILSLVYNQIDNNKLKLLVNNIATSNRLDNLLILNEKFNINEIYHDVINMNIINEKLVEIESLAESKKL